MAKTVEGEDYSRSWIWPMLGCVGLPATIVVVGLLVSQGLFLVLLLLLLGAIFFGGVMYAQRKGQQPMPNNFQTDLPDDDDVEGDKLR